MSQTGVCPRPGDDLVGAPSLDVRLSCDVFLVFGSDIRPPFIKRIGVVTNVVKMVTYLCITL